MLAKDLRVEPPRRWNVRVEGIPWLPRLIDKARAAQAGTLGSYLYGQSPMDRWCLQELGIGHREFANVVASCATDAEVVSALAARDPQSLERARAWAKDFERKHAAYVFAIDLDDGHILRPLKPALNLFSNSLTWVVKRIWPSRAAEGSR